MFKRNIILTPLSVSKVAHLPCVGWETGYIGANFGGGMQLELTDDIFLTTEVTGLFSRASSGRLTVGMHYRF